MLKVYDTMSEINAVPYVRHVAILHNKLVDAIGTVNSVFTYQVFRMLNEYYLSLY